MIYIILSELQFVFFFVCFVIKCFEEVFIYHLTISYIIIYYITIISNILSKMTNYIKFKVVEI